MRNGAEIAPGEPAAERDDYGQVVLAQRLRAALARLNPALPTEALHDVFRELTRPDGAELIDGAVIADRELHERDPAQLASSSRPNPDEPSFARAA